jgi:hypothetical protein
MLTGRVRCRHPISGRRLVEVRRQGLLLVVTANKTVAMLAVLGRWEDVHAILDAETEAAGSDPAAPANKASHVRVVRMARPSAVRPARPTDRPAFHTRPRFVSVPLGRVDHAWRSHHETPPKTRPSFERAPTSQTHLAGLRATDPPRRPRSTRQAHRGVARRASSRPRPRRPRLPSTSRAAWPRAVLQAEPAVPHDRCGRGNSRAVRSVSS